MMNNSYMGMGMGGFNPAFNPSLTPQQRLAYMDSQQYNQLMAQQQMPVQTQQPQQPQQAAVPVPTNKIFTVATLQEAQNAQIPMDGTVSYFAFGDTILARNWSFATGRIENKMFKAIVEEVETTTVEVPKEDRLKAIEEKLDTLITQSKYPINKNKGAANKDGE